MAQGVTAVVLDALLLLQLLALTVGAVFAAIAAYGYRGTPWGRVLRPLPFVLVTFCVGGFVILLPLAGDAGDTVATWLWALAILGIAVSVYEFVTLTTGRRAM